MTTILSSITLLTTEQGGRIESLLPIRDHRCLIYFPSLPALSQNGHSCFLLISEIGRAIAPGETVDGVPITFLYEEDVIPHLQVGTPFEIREGHVIGHGRVTRV